MIDELQALLGGDVKLHVDSVTGVLRYLRGDLAPLVDGAEDFTRADAEGDAEGKALAVAERLGRVMRIRSPREEFVVARSATDALGMVHVQLQQVYAGVPVWGAQVNVHFGPDGMPLEVSGLYTSTPVKMPMPAFEITEDEALRHAESAVGVSTPPGRSTVQVRRMVYWDRGRAPVLCYRVTLREAVDRHWQVFLDAVDGSVVHRYNAATTAAAVGTDEDVLGISREFGVWEEGGAYYCVNASLPMYQESSEPPDFKKTKGAVFVLDAMNQDLTGTMQVQQVTSTSIDTWDAAAVSLAHGLATVTDYYRNTHGRQSLDNKGMNVLGVIHVGQNMDNAFWASDYQGFFFGDGSGQSFRNLTAALDVIGHEFTHGVVSHTAGLIYENQSGAMNEFYADYLGSMVDREDWLIAEDAVVAAGKIALRDMANPANPDVLDQLPARMSEYRHMPTTEDNGGVHVNVGILNRMGYLLTAAGQGGIGRQKGETIFYRTLVHYLTQRSQFIDLRRAAVSAATDLYGADSAEVAAVKQAFDEVEILEGDATPPPTQAPTGEGENEVVFLQAVWDDWTWQYYYNLVLMEADGTLSTVATDVAETRPAISGDGRWGLYVDAYNDIWWTDGVSPEQWTTGGLVRTIALSKNLRTIAYTTSDYSDTLFLIDTESGEVTEIPLLIPAPDGPALRLAYADVLTFNFRGDYLAFDAVAKVAVQDGGEIPVWGLYVVRVADGSLQQLIPQAPGQQLGNPMFSHTRDYRLLADQVTVEGDVTHANMVAIDFHEMAQSTLIPDFAVLSQASYRGDDEAVVFRSYSETYQTYTLATAELASDGLGVDADTLSGELVSYDPFAYPVGFREYAEGAYVPQRGSISVAAEAMFGDVPVGGQSVTNLVVKNTGNADVSVFQIALGGDDSPHFAHNGMPQVIPPSQQLVVPIAFGPREQRAYQATLTLKSTDPSNPEAVVALAGTGVLTVNQPPSFTKGPDQSVAEDAGAQKVSAWATDIDPGGEDEGGQILRFAAEASAPDLFAQAPAVSRDGILSYTPAEDAFGSATVTVILVDDGGTDNGGDDTSVPQTFTIIVEPVNDSPSFHAGGNLTVKDDAGPQTVEPWATGISPGPANEASQAVEFMLTLTGVELFTVPPSLSTDGTLTFTPDPDADGGVSAVTVVLRDDGGTGNGGNDTSPEHAFTITVEDVGEDFDTDGDGLPDPWERTHCGDLRFLPADDPDGDGRTMLQEWQNATDPLGYDLVFRRGWNAFCLTGVVRPSGVTDLFGGEPAPSVLSEVWRWDAEAQEWQTVAVLETLTTYYVYATMDAAVPVETSSGSDCAGRSSARSARADTDGDLLDDDWETAHFDDLRFLAGDDADGDGATNAEEQSAGTDPAGYDIVLHAGWNAVGLAGVFEPNGIEDMFGTYPDSPVFPTVWRWDGVGQNYVRLTKLSGLLAGQSYDLLLLAFGLSRDPYFPDP